MNFASAPNADVYASRAGRVSTSKYFCAKKNETMVATTKISAALRRRLRRSYRCSRNVILALSTDSVSGSRCGSLSGLWPGSGAVDNSSAFLRAGHGRNARQWGGQRRGSGPLLEGEQVLLRQRL